MALCSNESRITIDPNVGNREMKTDRGRSARERERERDTETETETERQRERQTEIQRDR